MQCLMAYGELIKYFTTVLMQCLMACAISLLHIAYFLLPE